jgi:type III restriction enzyme
MNGATIELSRSRTSSDRIVYRVQGVERILSPLDVREIVPAQTYSQGELSHLGEERAESRLLELITDPARAQFDQFSVDLRRYANLLREELNRLVTGWNAERERRRLEAEMATVDARIASLQQELATGDVEAQRVVASHGTFVNTTEWLDNLARTQTDASTVLVSAMRQCTRSLEQLLAPEQVPSAPESQEAAVAARELTTTLRDLELVLATGEADFKRRLEVAKSAWAVERAAHEAKYTIALDTLAGQRSTADALRELDTRQGELRAQRDSFTQVIEETRDAFDRLLAIAGENIATHRSRERLAGEMASQVAELTGGLARASLYPIGDTHQLSDALTELFAGTRVREERLLALCSTIEREGNLLENWWSLIQEILEILRWHVTGLRETEERPRAPHLDAAIDSGGLDRFCERLTPDRVATAMIAEVEPRIQVTQRRGDYDVEFRRASQGEKAAILLSLLMKQPGGPLIIDQPEEDLDNRVIGEVVLATRNAKSRRQLIFATHNANLVVNGDAELVIEFGLGRAQAVGAIDTFEVCDAIATTMEGGREAFDLRRRKYNF